VYRLTHINTKNAAGFLNTIMSYGRVNVIEFDRRDYCTFSSISSIIWLIIFIQANYLRIPQIISVYHSVWQWSSFSPHG